MPKTIEGVLFAKNPAHYYTATATATATATDGSEYKKDKSFADHIVASKKDKLFAYHIEPKDNWLYDEQVASNKDKSC